jgi:hypothetical protein
MNNKLIDYVDFSIIKESIDSRYIGSKFEVYKNLLPIQKGAVSERIVKDVLKKAGYSVEPKVNIEHDFVFEGIKTELKSGTLNKDIDSFSFLQIRKDYDYNTLMLATFLPNDLRIFTLSKDRVIQLIQLGLIRPCQDSMYKWNPTMDDIINNTIEILVK